VPFVRHWMHVAMVGMDGHKMSKSRGNLVFVDALRREWDARAVRLLLVTHHYRREWEWHAGLPREATERLAAWRTAAGGDVRGAERVLDEVRLALDDDLDTPGAVRAIDDAARAGADVTCAAALLGVNLTAPVGPAS
jgi:L-cysteine:1D-myo-inositol 2-amino-2-deoxy-alpha-D-glucopyranoside ligase